MKENEIRPNYLYRTFLELNSKDIVRFFANDSNRLHRSCPGCGLDKYREMFIKDGFHVLRCIECDTLYVSPSPNEEALSKFYREGESQRYFGEVFLPAVANIRREKIWRHRVVEILRLFKTFNITPHRITDIGAAVGTFLEVCREEGLGTEWAGVEPHPSLAQVISEKGFDIFEGLASEASTDPNWIGSSSLVTSFETFEHVSSPEVFLKELATIAKPGGLILFTAVNGIGFDILVLGKRSNIICPPQHLNFLSPTGVRALLERCGLKEEAIITPGKLDVDIVMNILKE